MSMASSTGFFKPPILDLGVDRYASFKQWKARWEDYVIVSELGKKDPEYQCAMHVQNSIILVQVQCARDNNLWIVLSRMK